MDYKDKYDDMSVLINTINDEFRDYIETEYDEYI